MSRLKLLKIFAGLLALVVAFGAKAEIAGHPADADIRVVADCLSRQHEKNGAPDACIGALAAQCQSTALSPREKVGCNEKEAAVWGVAGVEDFTRLEAMRPSDSVRQALLEARSGYERAKSGLCAFERISQGNSPEGLLAASQCRLVETARQDLWLKRQIEALTNK